MRDEVAITRKGLFICNAKLGCQILFLSSSITKAVAFFVFRNANILLHEGKSKFTRSVEGLVVVHLVSDAPRASEEPAMKWYHFHGNSAVI